MIAAYTVASKTARVGGLPPQTRFTPGFAHLFEVLSVVSAATHPVKILWNKGMVIARQGNPSHVLNPFVTRMAHSQKRGRRGLLTQYRAAPSQSDHDDIGARNGSNAWHHGRLRLAVNKLVDLDRLHRGANRDFPTIAPASDERPSALANSLERGDGHW